MPIFTAVVLRHPNFTGAPATSLARVGDAEFVTVEAEDLDHVYAQLNAGNGRELPGYGGRSLSVGDLVLEGNHRDVASVPGRPATWLVAPFGFTRL